MTKALIVGCGIGGPVAALALRRAGIASVVYEGHARPADHVGTFLNTASNGLAALQSIGVDPHGVTANGFPTPRMVMWSGTGKRLGEMPNGLALPDGTVSITIKRGLLHRALREEAVRSGIQIENGKRLISAETKDDLVVARFDDGTEASGDLLIGADGLHSQARRQIDPDATPPRYTGQLSVGGIARGPFEPTPNAYQMIFGKRGFFGYSVRPFGETYWFANVAEAVAPTREQLAATSVDDWKRRLIELFADDAGPAAEMIRHTETELAAYPLFDMPTVRRWHRGRMVLLGDAAHATSPSSGQGASMAIEDAVELARCLRDQPNVERAFAAYESLRRARVERVVRYSKRVGSTKVIGPVGRYFRDLMMPGMLKLLAGSMAQDWLYRHRIEWEARVPA